MMKQAGLAIGILFVLCACSSGGGGGQEPPPAVSVTMTPAAARVNITRSFQFTARVEHATNTSVTWRLATDPQNNREIGTISDTGLYTAPYIVPFIPTVTVTATSLADTSKSASAQITILGPLTVALSPRDILVATGGTRTFLADVKDAAADGRVTWSLSGAGGSGPEYGMLSAEGAYTAPSAAPADPVVTITATSVEDTAVSDSTTATIKPVTNTDVIWTWASGGDKIRQTGVYGTKGISDPANAPGSRNGAATWLDPSGNLWLFGGEGADSAGSLAYFSDVWKYDPAVREWTWVSGSDLPDQPPVWGTKGVPGPANTPGPRGGPLFWGEPAGKLWLFGGTGLDAAGLHHVLGDLWSFDINTLEWTWVWGSDSYQFSNYGTKGVPDPSNVPCGRYRGVSWIDSAGKLWLFGGYGLTAPGIFYRLNDLWMYDPVVDVWTWVSGTDQPEDGGNYGEKGVPSTLNVPGARSDATAWIDGGGKLWLFGGSDYWGDSLYFNDLWSFDPATLEWTWVSGSDWPDDTGHYGTQSVPDPLNSPRARDNCVSWVDPDGTFWIFGGLLRSGLFNDLWRFDPATLEWAWMSGSDVLDPRGIYGTKNVGDLMNFPGGRALPMSWRDASGRFWLFGGWGCDTDNNQGRLNDLWHFTRVPPLPGPGRASAKASRHLSGRN